MKPFAPPLLLVSLLAVLPVGSAVAATSASASLDWNALTFTIIDTNPLDGLTPTLTWTSPFSQAYSYGYNTATGEHQYDSPYAYDFSTPLSSGLSFSNAGGNVSVNAASLSASSAASAAVAGSGGGVFVQEYATGQGSFTLSGAGIAYISLPYSISVHGTGGDVAEYSTASAYLYGYASSPAGSSTSYSGNQQLVSYSVGDASQTGNLGFALTNFSSTASVSGNVFAYAYTTSQAPIAAVPEPQSYAMLLAGLGMVAAVARRRRI